MIVNKLVSLNPDEYREMPLAIAGKAYIKYVQTCFSSQRGDFSLKSFKEWLETEI